MSNSRRVAVDLLIVGADIVSLDKTGTVIRNGSIAIKKNLIHWIGKDSEALNKFETSNTINGSGMIAMPGLIDTHVHSAQHLLRGKIAEIARRKKIRIPIWKNYYIPFEALLEPEDVYLSALACYANMISVGTTCFAEAGGPHPDEMGKAALKANIRGFLAKSTIDQGDAFPPSMKTNTKQAFKNNVDLVNRWKSNNLVKAWLSFRQIMTCSPKLIKMIAEAAPDLNTRIHTHLCEGSYEINYTMEQFGMRPAEYMESINSLNDHLHAAHSILLSPNELDLYIERNCSASHCPFNNYHVGPHPLLNMLHRGLRVGLGTDGAATWSSLDIFRAAHVARVGQQAVAGTPIHYHDIMPSEILIKVATNGGASALGLQDEIGSIEIGKKADILLLNCGEMDQFPLYDPLFAIATMMVGRDVQTVIIDGKVVMKNRELLTIDQEKLKHELMSRLPKIMERFKVLPE
jgi:5-methylthioadenosine/S-adenosylhomocysteine deaminase